MTSFPSSLKTKYTASGTDTLATGSHATVHNNIEDELIAVQTKVGVNSSAVNTTLDYKLSGVADGDKAVSKTGIETLTNKTLISPVINTPTGDIVTLTGSQTLTNKTISSGSTIDSSVTVVEVLKKVYPVGSIYISVVSTNPATLFGFGTWAAFGPGHALVGFASGDADFGTAEATTGSKTTTLTAAQSGLVGHNHTQNPHNHFTDPHGHRVQYATTGGSTSDGPNSSGGLYKAAGTWIENTTVTVQSVTATNIAASAANASEAHTNIQPSIVVFFFKRTA